MGVSELWGMWGQNVESVGLGVWGSEGRPVTWTSQRKASVDDLRFHVARKKA